LQPSEKSLEGSGVTFTYGPPFGAVIRIKK